MKVILFLVVCFSTSCLQTAELDNAPNLQTHFLKHSNEPTATFNEKFKTIAHKTSEEVLYFGSGTVLGSISLLAQLGWGISLISPWAPTLGNECLLLSHLCGAVAKHAFAQMFTKINDSSQLPHFEGIPLSQSSWYLNHLLLSKIPAFSPEQKKLLIFLEKRWLAKSTGFFPSVINWVCPAFGIFVQVNPVTSNTYARNPGNEFSQTYKNRVETWKKILPQPQSFPLVLTRPCNLDDYLPFFLDASLDDSIRETIAKTASIIQISSSKVIVDITHVFPENLTEQSQWLKFWQSFRDQVYEACKENNLLVEQILCVQRVLQEEIGGIRLLPLVTSPEEIEQQHRYLLEWISNFGLTANFIELDRWPLPTSMPATQKKTVNTSQISTRIKDEFVTYLNMYGENWKSDHPQKTLMVKGTLGVLKGMFATVTQQKWTEIENCPTRSSLVLISILKIADQLNRLIQEVDTTLFFDLASRIELVHAEISSLLEVLSPYTEKDFPSIYREVLTTIPDSIKSFASFGIHSSGMTSLAGIFKALERTLGTLPHVIYGENTYFESIYASHLAANAIPIQEAREEDWQDVELILAQFNPVLRRIDYKATEYKAENISGTLHTALKARQGNPLTLALDCTLDLINSPRVKALLEEFQGEILNGTLNVIGYRSGLKFDLFGMDNYCGAPYYMVHNKDPKWDGFNSLQTDLVLQTDRLSLNWFCLAYQNAFTELDQYRRQIFENTRALLNKVPKRLLDNNYDYRIIPFEEGADAAFLDIKIFGPLHRLRGAGLVGGSLYLKCMEGKQPIFYRPSLGFYHPNFTMLFGKECTTIRLTLGLDPAQVDVLSDCFEMIDTLNGSPWQLLLDKLLPNVFMPSFSYL